MKIIYLFLLLPILFFGQNFSDRWEGHFSYNNINTVVEGNGKIFAAAENAIFIYDPQTNTTEEITTVNGLSGDNITTISYSEDFNLLLIGYDNGLLQVYFDDAENEVLTVIDIANRVSIIPELRRINHFTIQNNLAYIATGFGISVFNIERLEFGDTFIIGDQGAELGVMQTAIFNGFIYAATLNGGGIRRANLQNTNLIDFRSWTVFSNGSFTGVEFNSDRLYALSDNRRLLDVTNGNPIQIATFDNVPVEINAKEGNLLVTTSNTLFVYNANAVETLQVPLTGAFNTTFRSATLLSNSFYIGTQSSGVLKTFATTPSAFEAILPQGPILNTPFSVTAALGELWVTFGDFTQFYNPFPLRSRGVSHLRASGEWININFEDIFGTRNLNTIAINPLNRREVFISSFEDGILEIRDDEPFTRFDETNSGLESLVLSSDPSFRSVRVSGLEFDEEGVLWSVTSLTQNPLKSYNPSTQVWSSFDFSQLISRAVADGDSFNKIVIDQEGTKFISSSTLGLIGFNEKNGAPRIKNISEEQNLPISEVRTLALDRQNQLWIGTREGLRVLFNTSNFFDQDVTAQEIIISEDGVARELLFRQFISDIEVDASNNKWIATFDAGLFYVSPDGQQTIFHFTRENSPLPSNVITDVSIDESQGLVYIATDKGLLSFSTGSTGFRSDFSSARAYPNPVRPTFDIVEERVKITDLAENVNIKIVDIEGNLVAEAQTGTNRRFSGFNLEIDGGTAFWNGKNLANNVVATGVYLIMLADLDSLETKVIKLLVVR